MNRYVFCLDVESNGLYGDGFAYAVVVIEYNSKKKIEEKTGYYKEYTITDEFTINNVLPMLEDLEIYNSLEDMRSSFWNIYLEYFSNRSHYYGKVDFLVDNGFPVESNFLSSCVKDNIKRINNSPFPVYDVATLLKFKGISNTIDRMYYSNLDKKKHNPINDAEASARCWIKLQDSRDV